MDSGPGFTARKESRVKLTRQGVRDLDTLGKPPARGHRATVAGCSTPEDHEWGAWSEDVRVDGTGHRSWCRWRTCERCGITEERWQ